MGTQRCVGLNIYLVLLMQLTFLVGIGSCIQSSSFLSEVDRSISTSDYSNPNNRAFSHIDKYVMKPYFEKYDNLFDSNFQDFLVQELSLGSCDTSLLPRLPVLERHLIGEGSHRRLSSSIRFDIQLDTIPTHFCEIIMVEKLPSGVFADPFELQHLYQQGELTDAAVFGDTNLELPSKHSNRSLVELHMDIGPKILSTHSQKEINVQLPLHARYPPLKESGSYSEVEFSAPVVFMRCSIKGKSHSQSCLFMSKDDDDESSNTTVVWEMPSGIKAHAGVVSVVTFVSAMLLTFVIVLTSVYASGLKLSKNLKRS